MGRRILDRAGGRRGRGAHPRGGAAPLQGPLDPLSWRRAWAIYFVAHSGKSLLWTASDLLTLYVLVSWYAVAPVVAGGLFLAGLTANALADLGVGLWLDRRPRDAAPLAGAALLLAAAVFPATMLLASLGPGALLAATLLFRVAYSGCDVPHNALMSRLGDAPDRAKRLSRARTVGTGLAALAMAGGVSLAGAVPIGWMLGGIALLSVLLGATMVPLLARYGIAAVGGPATAGSRIGLPLPFLAASLTGIVALGALGKAVLHLPDDAAPLADSTMLALLIVGRTLSACVPFRFASAAGGLALLAGAYALSAAVPAAFLLSAGAVAPLLLGFAMGFTNLVGWALLPLLARAPRDYGLYAMASKLALGAAGLALAGGLGRASSFAPSAFPRFAAGIAVACLVAGALALPRLTSARRRALHGR